MNKNLKKISLGNVLITIVSIALSLWMLAVVIKFDMHIKNICSNVDQIYQDCSERSIDDSKILQYHDSKISTEGLLIAFIGVIVTFLAFYIQYEFNKQQKKDISSERTENQLFHLMDVYRNICNNSVIDSNISGKRAFHYMFYEYKAIFNIINEYISSCNLEMSIEDKNYLSFVFFLNGLTPNALPTYKNYSLDDESKIKLLTSIRELLYIKRDNRNITYLLDYKERNIIFADGHRPIIIPYIKYVNLIIDFIINQTSDNDSRKKYIRFLSSEMTHHEIGLIYAFNSYIKKVEENNDYRNYLESGYKFIYQDLPIDIGFKFKFDNKDFFNRKKINID